jgi:hypothetical protein
MNNIPKISWKVIRNQLDCDEISIEFDGDKKNAFRYYENISKKKMKPGSVIALIDPKGSSITSRHAKALKIDEIMLKKMIIKNTAASLLFILFIFLILYNLHNNILISNVSFIASVATFITIIFYSIKLLKNRRKTVYINL